MLSGFGILCVFFPSIERYNAYAGNWKPRGAVSCLRASLQPPADFPVDGVVDGGLEFILMSSPALLSLS